MTPEQFIAQIDAEGGNAFPCNIKVNDVDHNFTGMTPHCVGKRKASLMTPEAQRIAIAEAWGLCTHPKESQRSETIEDGNDCDTSYWCEKCGKDFLRNKIPDYLSDLNAIHEAVSKWVGGDLKRASRYSGILMGVVQDRRHVVCAVDARYLTAVADAGEHCEAFLQAIGRWVP